MKPGDLVIWKNYNTVGLLLNFEVCKTPPLDTKKTMAHVLIEGIIKRIPRTDLRLYYNE